MRCVGTPRLPSLSVHSASESCDSGSYVPVLRKRLAHNGPDRPTRVRSGCRHGRCAAPGRRGSRIRRAPRRPPRSARSCCCQGQGQFVAFPYASRGEPEEAFQEDRRSHRDDRQPRPGQGLLRKPVQLVLRAVGGLGDAHRRDRHLRHVHESLDAMVPRDRGDVDRGFQIGRRDRHSEIDACTTFDRRCMRRGRSGCPARLRHQAVAVFRRVRPPAEPKREPCALASSMAVRLRPIAPISPAAPVARIGLSCARFHRRIPCLAVA